MLYTYLDMLEKCILTSRVFKSISYLTKCNLFYLHIFSDILFLLSILWRSPVSHSSCLTGLRWTLVRGCHGTPLQQASSTPISSCQWSAYGGWWRHLPRLNARSVT